jgi:hypothetical protein
MNVKSKEELVHLHASYVSEMAGMRHGCKLGKASEAH